MTLQAIFNWENQDATSDLNERFRSLFSKGCISGGYLAPVSGQLQIDITPNQVISFDGMLVSDAVAKRLDIPLNQTTVITLYSKHNIGVPASLEYRIYEASVFSGLLDKDYHSVYGSITLGSAATEVLPVDISYDLRDEQTRLARASFRGWLLNSTLLPSSVNPPYTNLNRPGDFYIINQGVGDIPAIYAWNGLAWVNISDTLALTALLSQHRSNMLTNEVHLTDDQSDAALGTFGLPSVINKYVTEADPKLPTLDENDAMLGSDGTPSVTNRFITEDYPVTYPTTYDYLIPPGGAIQVAGDIFVGSGSSAVSYFSFVDYTLNRGYVNSYDLPVTTVGVFKDPLLVTPLIPSVDADALGYYNGTVYLQTDNTITGSFKILYGSKSTLKTVLKDFNYKPTSAIDTTGNVVVSRVAKIMGRNYDDPIPTRENNKSLRHSVDNVMAYLGSVLETNIVAAKEDYDRLQSETVIGQEFVKNEGVNDIMTFDNIGLSPYSYSTGVVSYGPSVDLSGVNFGNLFVDGQNTEYVVVDINFAAHTLTIADKNSGAIPNSINTSLNYPSGSTKVNFNTRDQLLSEMKYNLQSDIYPIYEVSTIDSEFSRKEGFFNAGLVASGIKNGDRLEPRVVFYGEFENFVSEERERYVRISGVGKISITGFFTDVILYLRRKPTTSYFSVMTNGEVGTSVSVQVSAGGLVSATQAGKLGFKYHKVVLASGLSSTSPSSISATTAASASAAMDIFAIEIVRSNSPSIGLLESGIAFRATELLKRSALTNVTLPQIGTRLRGGRTLVAVEENGYDFSFAPLSDLDSGVTPQGTCTGNTITISNSGGKLGGYAENDIIAISNNTTKTEIRRVTSLAIYPPNAGSITLDSATSFSGDIVYLTHICNTNVAPNAASSYYNAEEDEFVRYNLFRDFIQHTLTDFELPESMDRYVVHRDGLTILAGQNISVETTNLSGAAIAAKINTAGSLKITALCTRLDIITANRLNTAGVTVSIDGSPLFPIAFDYGNRRHTLMSNARYQSHEILITAGDGELCITDLILFCPRKQDFSTYKNVVADLRQLARYVPSDSIRNTPYLYPLGGAFYEANIHISYIDGTGAGSNWMSSLDFSLAYYGNYIWTNRLDARAEFCFLGDTFELQYIKNTDHGTFAVYVDGVPLQSITGTIIGDYSGDKVNSAGSAGRQNIGMQGMTYGYHKVEAVLLTGKMAFNGYYVGNNTGYMSLGLNNSGIFSNSIDARKFIPITSKPLISSPIVQTPSIRADEIALSSGSQNIVVTFSTPMPDANYIVTPSIVATIASPIYFPVNVTNRTRHGFTAIWNAAMPDNSYKLAYTAINKI